MARSRSWRLGAALVSIIALPLAGLGPAGSAAAREGTATEEPATRGSTPWYDKGIDWKPCFTDQGPDFECAMVKVPLDYDRPHGPRISLALTRLPATNPSTRVGSLFVNPGGPGGSGVDFVVGFGPFTDLVYGPGVRARYDLVGFDPRGVARSTPLTCFDTLEEAFAAIPPIAFPLSSGEIREIYWPDRRLARACEKQGGPIGWHMSTANVARDLEVLRQRVGDTTLNYAGFSYGSFLGVTYANLFPDKVGAMVVDAVLDPVAWVNQGGRIPFSSRIRSDEGAQETLEKLFELCREAGPDSCALAPNPAERFDAVAKRLRAEPLVVVDPDGGEFVLDYQTFIAVTLSVLYDPFAYPFLADAIAELEGALRPARVRAALNRLAEASPLAARHLGDDFPEFPEYRNFVEATPGVACTDSQNPRRYRAWWREGRLAEKRFGYFGPIRTWASSECAQWPFRDRDRYKGPFTARTATPVLVVNTLYDPATRYEGAQTVRRLLPNSSLLSVDMPGHTTLGLSGCAGALVGRYLVDPSVAPGLDGLTCPQEFNPFTFAATLRSAASGLQPELRDQLLDEIALLPGTR